MLLITNTLTEARDCLKEEKTKLSIKFGTRVLFINLFMQQDFKKTFKPSKRLLRKNKKIRSCLRPILFLIYIKGTVIRIEKALINDRLLVLKVS